MAVDVRLLNGVRRFWDQALVESTYQRILDAYMSRLDKVSVIISKATEGESAGGQVVVVKEDYLEWMDVLETRLQEIAAAAGGTTLPQGGAAALDFSGRYTES